MLGSDLAAAIPGPALSESEMPHRLFSPLPPIPPLQAPTASEQPASTSPIELACLNPWVQQALPAAALPAVIPYRINKYTR